MLCSLGVHTLLGCCWHHAHADASSETLANSQGEFPQQSRPHIHLGCGGHHHHHNHSHDSDETESRQAPHDPAGGPQDHRCQELSCEYVTSAPSKLPLSEMDQPDATPQLIASGKFRSQLLDSQAGRRSVPRYAGSRALEIRDATQVWLL
jgi:hypothetical protein